jgi:hypothetical protein
LRQWLFNGCCAHFLAKSARAVEASRACVTKLLAVVWMTPYEDPVTASLFF